MLTAILALSLSASPGTAWGWNSDSTRIDPGNNWQMSRLAGNPFGLPEGGQTYLMSGGYGNDLINGPIGFLPPWLNPLNDNIPLYIYPNSRWNGAPGQEYQSSPAAWRNYNVVQGPVDETQFNPQFAADNAGYYSAESFTWTNGNRVYR